MAESAAAAAEAFTVGWYQNLALSHCHINVLVGSEHFSITR